MLGKKNEKGEKNEVNIYFFPREETKVPTLATGDLEEEFDNLLYNVFLLEKSF